MAKCTEINLLVNNINVLLCTLTNLVCFLCMQVTISRLVGEKFTIVQLLNHLMYHHVHFYSVVCLERTFISQDTEFFPGSSRVFSSAQLVVRTQSLSYWILSSRLSAAMHFDFNKLGKVPS